MVHPPTRSLLLRSLLGALMSLLVWASADAQPATRLSGRQLNEALRLFQSHGLRVIFTSELVSPDMRVLTEPRAAPPRDRLVEILRPHGLAAEDGPGGTILVVRARPSRGPRPEPTGLPEPQAQPAAAPEPVANVHQERVTVAATPDLRSGSHPLPEYRLSAADLRRFGGHAIDDPVRAMQGLPGVSASHDFSSALSVRGSLPRHAALVVDGVYAPWLQHQAPGRGETGAVTMVGAEVVEDMALHVGGYARLDGSQLGPQVNLNVREGGRARTTFGARVTSNGAGAVGEGPLGSRGAWLVGLRRSVVEWPLRRQDDERSVFGSTDVQSKIVFDVTPTQQVLATVVAGTSKVERDHPDPRAAGDGVNRASLASVAWRATGVSGVVLRQQVFDLTHAFTNRDATARVVNEGTDRAFGYRVDVTRPVAGGLLETGGQVKRVAGSRHGAAPATGEWTADLDAAWVEGAAYASARHEVAPGLIVAPGARMSRSSRLEHPVIDRWIEVQFAPRARWLVHGNAAVIHQLPDLDRGHALAARTAPESGRVAEIGIGHGWRDALAWRVTAFSRRERNLWSGTSRWSLDAVAQPGVRLLNGDARGVEVTLERRGVAGPSGWLTYTWARSHYTERESGETFRSDLDQRHAFSAAMSWPLPGAVALGLSFRAGSPLIVPHNRVARDQALFAAPRPDAAQLPAYARLDLRAERAFTTAGRRVVLFGEVLNVLDRPNYGQAVGRFDPYTGQLVGAIERLYPRLATVGVRVEF